MDLDRDSQDKRVDQTTLEICTNDYPLLYYDRPFTYHRRALINDMQGCHPLIGLKEPIEFLNFVALCCIIPTVSGVLHWYRYLETNVSSSDAFFDERGSADKEEDINE